jgi:hypothetical protein
VCCPSDIILFLTPSLVNKMEKPSERDDLELMRELRGSVTGDDVRHVHAFVDVGMSTLRS